MRQPATDDKIHPDLKTAGKAQFKQYEFDSGGLTKDSPVHDVTEWYTVPGIKALR